MKKQITTPVDDGILEKRSGQSNNTLTIQYAIISNIPVFTRGYTTATGTTVSNRLMFTIKEFSPISWELNPNENRDSSSITKINVVFWGEEAYRLYNVVGFRDYITIMGTLNITKTTTYMDKCRIIIHYKLPIEQICDFIM